MHGGRQILASGGSDSLIKTWLLDWELDTSPPAEWDAHADRFLQVFLTRHTPRQASGWPRLWPGRPKAVNQAATEATTWKEHEFESLLAALADAGFGWLDPESVRGRLGRLARKRTELPPAPRFRGK